MEVRKKFKAVAAQNDNIIKVFFSRPSTKLSEDLPNFEELFFYLNAAAGNKIKEAFYLNYRRNHVFQVRLVFWLLCEYITNHLGE